MKGVFNPTADKKKIELLEGKANDYHNALIGAINKIITKKGSDEKIQKKIENFKNESVFVSKLLHSDILLNEHEFTLEWVKKNNLFETLHLEQFNLPNFYRNEQIRKAYRFIQNDLGFESWKNSGYNKTFGLELAQCMALEKYSSSLPKRIKELSSSLKNNLESKISYFKWQKSEKLLIKLYEMTNGKYVECSRTEFLQAFSGQLIEIDQTIKWIVQTKNKKHISKVSLFYFLDELLNKEMIAKQKDLYGVIRKIFFYGDKKSFKNLPQSFGNAFHCVEKEDIDSIIDSVS